MTMTVEACYWTGRALALRPAEAHGRAGADETAPAAQQAGLLTLTIKDKSALYLAYIAVVRNGGLFIRPTATIASRRSVHCF